MKRLHGNPGRIRGFGQTFNEWKIFRSPEWNELDERGRKRRWRLFAEETLAIKLIRGYLINYGERTIEQMRGEGTNE